MSAARDLFGTAAPPAPSVVDAATIRAAVKRERIAAFMAAAGFGPAPDAPAPHQENPTP